MVQKKCAVLRAGQERIGPNGQGSGKSRPSDATPKRKGTRQKAYSSPMRETMVFSGRKHMVKIAYFKTLLLLTLMISSAWAAAPDGQEDICATSAVIFCDNFEARSIGSGDLGRITYKSGWALSEFTNLTVIDASSGNTYSGTRALQFRYPASTDGIGFMQPNFSGTYQDLYFRWYQKWSANFQFSPIATKGAETTVSGGASGQSMYFLWNNWGDGEISHYAQNVTREFSANTNGGTWSPTLGQWYCVEERFRYNTNGANGIVEGWIDNVKRWDYPNVQLDNNGTVINGMVLSGYWNNSTGSQGNPAGVAHPLMSRWHDNFVISTQRIGCLGSAPSLLPTAPTGLAIQ